MELEFSGRAFVVTGGSSGIGLAVARALVAEGAQVMIVGRDRDRFAAAVATCGEGPGGVESVALDITTPDAPDELLRAARAAFGAVPGLVNCAGSVRAHDLMTAKESEWDEQWELNVEAPRRLMDAFAPALAASGGGSIVNVCSSAGRRPSATYPAYAVSKRGELALSILYAERYGPQGVRVDAVAPGPTATPLWTEPGGLLDQVGLDADGDREAALQARGEGLPAGRMAEPAEIADVIVFLLAGRRGGGGAVWSVDGGHVTDVFP